jgi:2,5-diketo-D-gluconate reductase B
VVAYSSFSSYPFVMEPMDDPIVNWIASRHSATSAQIILKWALNKGFAVIPRSTSKTNLASNLKAPQFELSEAEMGMIDSLQHLVDSHVTKAVPV